MFLSVQKVLPLILLGGWVSNLVYATGTVVGVAVAATGTVVGVAVAATGTVVGVAVAASAVVCVYVADVIVLIVVSYYSFTLSGVNVHYMGRLFPCYEFMITQCKVVVTELCKIIRLGSCTVSTTV